MFKDDYQASINMCITLEIKYKIKLTGIIETLERAKKVEKELKYTEEQFDKYWKEVCILKPRLAKVEELLELYRLEKEAKEKYHTSGSLYVMQHVLDELREIAEEINLKEKLLEELK